MKEPRWLPDRRTVQQPQESRRGQCRHCGALCPPLLASHARRGVWVGERAQATGKSIPSIAVPFNCIRLDRLTYSHSRRRTTAMAPSQESLYPFRHEGSVRSPGRYWFFWALVFAAGSLLSCGRDDTRTCLELTITYAGSKSGAAYLRVVSDDGGQSYFIGETPLLFSS